MNETENGTDEMQSEPEEKNTLEGSVETLSTASKSLSTRLNEESIQSMNYVSSSVSHLHELMKSVAQPFDKDKDMRRMDDVQRVNAACNCAKNMTNPLKFQLDLLKEMKP